MGSAPDRRIKLYRGAWYVVWRDGGRTRREALHTKDRAQAERNFREYLRQSEGTANTVSEILDLWAEKKSNLKSIEIAKVKFKPLKAFFGNYLPEHINRDLCKKYILQRNRKNTTIRNELAVLRCALNWHDKHNKAEFEFPPVDPPKDHYLTRDEYFKLLDCAWGVHVKLFIVLALHTAGRVTALLELTWDRVDFEKGLINLAKGDHKNKRRALVPMNDTLRKALEKAYIARTTEYVIEHGSKPIKSIRKGFKEAARRAGVEASPHVLRHTAAVVMAEAGVDIREIGQFLGHQGHTTTDRVYARYSPSYLQKAASALDIWAKGSN